MLREVPRTCAVVPQRYVSYMPLLFCIFPRPITWTGKLGADTGHPSAGKGGPCVGHAVRTCVRILPCWPSISVHCAWQILDGSLLSDLVWSDPDTSHEGWISGKRGISGTFGMDMVRDFLEKFGFRTIIRAHQVCCASNILFRMAELLTP